VLEGSLHDPAAASARVPVSSQLTGRSPALEDTWWVCSNEDAFPCSSAQHAYTEEDPFVGAPRRACRRC